MTRARWARVTGLSGPFPAACHRLISRRAGSVAGTVLAVPGCGAAAGTASGPQAYLDAERRRHPVPRLTPRQNELLRLLAAGHTNSQIAHRSVSPREPCAPTWRTSTKSWASPAVPPPSPAPSPARWRRRPLPPGQPPGCHSRPQRPVTATGLAEAAGRERRQVTPRTPAGRSRRAVRWPGRRRSDWPARGHAAPGRARRRRAGPWDTGPSASRSTASSRPRHCRSVPW